MTAPQVTPADVEATIASEHYFRAADGIYGTNAKLQIQLHGEDSTLRGVGIPHGQPIYMLTYCVLVLKNGHIVSGEAYCADPAKFNAETGRIEARKAAINKLWPMVVYAQRHT